MTVLEKARYMIRNIPPVTVSIIIPTYNRAWCLPQAVASVLEQSFRDFEVIIVDDGSGDGSAQIASSWGPPVRALHQTNQGVSAARNRGIRASSGRLLAFLDSDNWWQPEKLARQVSFFDTHPDAMICQTEEIWIRRGVRVEPQAAAPQTLRLDFRSLPGALPGEPLGRHDAPGTLRCGGAVRRRAAGL